MIAKHLFLAKDPNPMRIRILRDHEAEPLKYPWRVCVDVSAEQKRRLHDEITARSVASLHYA
jgi:hypothetical protein